MWDLKSIMFEVVIKGWVAIVSWAYLLDHPYIWSYLLLALWASHRYYIFYVLSLHLPIILSWGPCSVYMLWLDTSWVSDLVDIFSSYLSFFSAIFPHWHHRYHFSLHHISSFMTFIFSSFPSSLLTWHYICFILSGGFSNYWM